MLSKQKIKSMSKSKIKKQHENVLLWNVSFSG